MGRRGRGGGGGGMFQVSGDRGHDHDFAPAKGGRGGGGAGGRGGGGGVGGGGRGSAGGSKTNVSFLAPAAPSFIQKLRAQHGLKSREETHKDQLQLKQKAAAAVPSASDLDSRPVMDDEAPQVVVLRKSHLSLDQVQDAVDSGARGVDHILGPAAKKARVDGDDDVEDEDNGSDKTDTAGETSTGVSRVEKNRSKEVEKIQKIKKKKKIAQGAMSKKLNKKNVGVLSFGDDDGDDF